MVRYGKKSQEAIAAVIDKVKKNTKKSGHNLKKKIVKRKRAMAAGISKTIQKVKDHIKHK